MAHVACDVLRSYQYLLHHASVITIVMQVSSCHSRALPLAWGMLGRTYDHQICSAARALEIVGERWSLLILRDAAFAGYTRFTDFQKRLNLSPNVLTARLELFVETGVMTTEIGADGFPNYHLTKKGFDLVPVIVALTEWGDRHASPEGAPIAFEHADCGGRVKTGLHCKRCGESPHREDVFARPTPVMERLREQRKGRRRSA
jgi:DNA-binding HxlR family transcriptional regulator